MFGAFKKLKCNECNKYAYKTMSVQQDREEEDFQSLYKCECGNNFWRNYYFCGFAKNGSYLYSFENPDDWVYQDEIKEAMNKIP